jgi:hypothetical protein
MGWLRDSPRGVVLEAVSGYGLTVLEKVMRCYARPPGGGRDGHLEDVPRDCGGVYTTRPVDHDVRAVISKLWRPAEEEAAPLE